MTAGTSPPDRSESVVDYYAADQRQRRRDQRRQSFSEWQEAASRVQSDGAYGRLAAILRDELLPRVAFDRSSVARYSADVTDDADWYPGAVRRVVGDLDGYVARGAAESLSRYQKQSLVGAFRSIITAAAVEGVIDDVVVRDVPAWEYEHQVGVRHYSPESNGKGEAEMIDADENAELKATLVTGGQGSGKSTFVETLVEDRMERGHVIIDLLDFFKSENAMYDIEQRQDVLTEIREEMGLDTGFDDHDPPRVEVYAPLTDSLADSMVPYDEEADRHVVRPFTIPASELTYRQLVMLLPHTTKTQENYLKSAHQKLSKQDRDWTLQDVATVVRHETNAGDTVAHRIERGLETAQAKGFIRDERCDHTLDWDEVMTDPATVASFTVHLLRESADQKVIASYLMDSLYEERKRLIREKKLHEYPTLSVVMRELHKVAPRSTSEQDSEATIENYMTDTMADLLALMRHVDMEIIADTQKFKQQLSSDVSGLFHRVFAFRGQKPDVREVFRTRIDNADPAETVAGFDEGECALVSGDGYTMPISAAPPRSHHLDTGADGDGLSARVRYLDHEEFTAAPWSSTVPPRLTFDGRSSPAERFCHQCLTVVADREQYEFKHEVTEAYEAWATENGEDQIGHDQLHRQIKNYFDALGGETDARLTHETKGKKTAAHRKLKLTYDPPPDPGEGGNMGYV